VLSRRSLFLKPSQAGIEALVLRDHCMQLVENPVKSPFETQYDGGQDSQIVACGILFGSYPFQLLAEKFQGNPPFTHATKHGRPAARVNPEDMGFGDKS
jgi:hypothetical protein